MPSTARAEPGHHLPGGGDPGQVEAAVEAMAGSEDFARLTDPFRPELLAHCYRMLGSVHDAEDQVQETLLRAWRAYPDYDGRRASLRTWLYRIATNACLTAIEHRGRRALPSGLVAPSTSPEAPLQPAPAEVAWLQPVPDALLPVPAADPAAVVAGRASVRLAFVAALQHLPPRQRTVLILRDVLAWRAAEVADLLATSTAAVNSALQRARTQLAQAAPVEDEVAEPTDPAERDLVDRFVAAFVNADLAALADLLRADAQVEMPPWRTWFAGREAALRFFRPRFVPGRWRMLPIGANGQPAVAGYLAGPDGGHRAHSIILLTPGGGGRLARVTAFHDPGLFGIFGLPASPR
jgi:RNA polymerase sigma-70 factor (ECF subfamily)